MSIEKHSIGPFLFEKDTVTLAPGIYKLHEPIVFGVTPETKIEGTEYNPLLDSDASTAVRHDAATDYIAA